MSEHPAITDAFWALLAAACDGELTAGQHAELEVWLSNHAEAQRLFLDHIRMRRQIRSWARGERTCRAGLERVAAMKDARGTLNDELHMDATAAPPSALPPTDPSSFILHSSLVSGVLLSYVAVAILLGVGTLAAWAWKLPHGPALRAVGPAAIEVVETIDRAAGPTTPVGQITQTVGCRWTNMMITKETPTKDLLTVSLGARYIVDAGLLEITYYSGAKVILEGPAVYEVDGSNGGFLRTGAATFLYKTPTKERAATAASPASQAAEGQFFCVHVPCVGTSDRATVRLRDMALSLKVDERGDLTTRALSPAVAQMTPDIAKYAAPTNPSATVGVDAKGRPFLIVVKEPPAAQKGPLKPNETAVSSSDMKEKKKKKG